MKLAKYKLAVMAIIFADIIWGATPPVLKWSIENIHVFTLAFFRYAIPAFLIILLGSKYVTLKKRDALIMFLIGITNVSLNVGLYFLAMEYTMSINVPVIASAGPVFLILGSILFLNEHPSRKMLLGNLIGLTGVILIVLQPVLGNFQSGSIFGNVLLILSTIFSVIGTLLAKKIARRYHPLTICFWSFVIGALSFFPFFYSETLKFGFLQNLNYQGLSGLVWGSFLASLLGNYFLYWGLRYIKASEVSVFTYIDPVSAVFIAIPLLGEYPSPIFLTGTLLIFAGIFVAEGRLHYHPIHKLFAKSYAVD